MHANKIARRGCCGIHLEIISSGINTRSSEDNRAPANTNGKASRRMPIKAVLNVSMYALLSNSS
jgi:hypothetical protein